MRLIVEHHLLLCATSTKAKCCDHKTGLESWKCLKDLIEKFDLENPARKKGIVLRSKVDCLRICREGPILLVWPDGIWYGNVTPEKIVIIINQHILRGNPVEEWIIKRTSMSFGA